jgi:ABC-type uncharacterized transport system permease subunit
MWGVNALANHSEARPAEPQLRAALHNKTQITQELKWLALGYVALSIAFFVAFQKTETGALLRATASIYWMFVLPGYALSLCSRQGFVERFIIGVSVQAAVFGLASYYAGLLGWHVATHGLVLPFLSIIIGIILWWKREKTDNRHAGV